MNSRISPHTSDEREATHRHAAVRAAAALAAAAAVAHLFALDVAFAMFCATLQLWATSGRSKYATGTQFQLWRVDADGSAVPFGSGSNGGGGDVVASPSDRSTLYVADTGTSGSPGPVFRYDVSTGTPVLTAVSPAFGQIRQIAPSPNGRLVSVANAVSVVDLDAVSLQPVATHTGTAQATGIAWSRNGKAVAVAQGPPFAAAANQIGPDAVVLPAGKDTPLISIGGTRVPSSVPHGVAFTPDGTRVFVVSFADKVSLPTYQLSSYDLTPPTT